MERLILASAREVTALADHSKFGRVTTVRVATLVQIWRVVTDRGAPADQLAALRERGIAVEVA